MTAEAGGAVNGPTYALRSNVGGASLVRLDELPRVSAQASDETCSDRFVEPRTDGGRIAAQGGWRIVQEEKLGELDAVLVVRALSPMTSGRCEPHDANVALFEETRLVGVLYAKGKSGIEISALEALPSKIRIWSPAPLLQGEIVRDGTNLSFEKPAASEAVCSGRYRVPAIFNAQYADARSDLIANGWRPVPSIPDPEMESDFNAEARKQFPEIGECAGTGYGECEFGFASNDGRAGLGVNTIGGSEDPMVSSYRATCHGKSER